MNKQTPRTSARAATVDEYIAAFPDKLGKRLSAIRKTIQAAAPDAEEAISYGMPGYKLNGALIYFAAWTNHIGVYPVTDGVKQALRNQLTGYEMSKGTLRFPLEQAPPLPLIRAIVKHRAAENAARLEAKRAKRLRA